MVQNRKCQYIRLTSAILPPYAIVPTRKRILFPHYIYVSLRQVIFLNKQNTSANSIQTQQKSS